MGLFNQHMEAVHIFLYDETLKLTGIIKHNVRLLYKLMNLESTCFCLYLTNAGIIKVSLLSKISPSLIIQLQNLNTKTQLKIYHQLGFIQLVINHKSPLSDLNYWTMAHFNDTKLEWFLH